MSKPTVRRYLKLLAPGTPLRAGVDRILQGRTGALIVLGNNQAVHPWLDESFATFASVLCQSEATCF